MMSLHEGHKILGKPFSNNPHLSVVLPFQSDSPLDTAPGLQEGLSLSPIRQVVNEQTRSVHSQVQQGLGQHLPRCNQTIYRLHKYRKQ